MKIDIHAHHVDRRYNEQLQTGFTRAWTRPDMFDVDHRLRDMDKKGIDMRVLSLSTPSVYPWTGESQVRITRHVNDELAQLCRVHTDRFIGLASLPLQDVEA